MFLLRFLGWIFAVVTIVGLAAAGVGIVYVREVASDLPDTDNLKNYAPPVMSRFHAADGELVAEYARERRLFVPIQIIPDRVKQAFISAEDKDFYHHAGIDLTSIAAALVRDIELVLNGRRAQGGSTITQQVAKNFFTGNERSVDRKIKEAIVSMRMESTYSKDQILELYLNEIFLGSGAYGVASAALTYFDKSLDDLTLPEIAYLAALPKGPNNYNPWRNTDKAIERRNYVIQQMLDNGYVTAQEARAAKAEPIGAVENRQREPAVFASDYFVEEARRQILAQYGDKGLYEGGLSVRLTMDPRLQVLARKALLHGLISFDEAHGWRGPVKTLVMNSGDWGQALANEPTLADVPEWRLAIVLASGTDEARIGLQPRKRAGGELGPERERAVIPLSALGWAKKNGRAPKSTAEVLNPGDVIYVEKLETVSSNGEPSYRLRQVPEISGAIVAMDPVTGSVKAMVGGFSYGQSEFNRATQAYRQPGSSFKPFVYSAALDNGYLPTTLVLDAPFEFDPGGGQPIWHPQNYGNDFLGPSTLRTGIERSRNLMTVRLAQDLGMNIVAQYAEKFGIYDHMQPYLPMALGAGETTVLRMVNAYSMIANGGRRVQPSVIDRVQDRYGKTVYKHDQRVCKDCNAQEWRGQDEPQIVDEREQVLDSMTAYQITSIMQGVIQRGTATALRVLGRPIAGKTGTTNESKDVWFCGFTTDMVVGLYLGYDKPRPMGRQATGGAMSAPIARDFLGMALAGQAPVEFPVPEGIKFFSVDRKTGLIATAGAAGTILEPFKPGTQPSDTMDVIGGGTVSSTPPVVSPEAEKAVTSGTGGLY